MLIARLHLGGTSVSASGPSGRWIAVHRPALFRPHLGITWGALVSVFRCSAPELLKLILVNTTIHVGLAACVPFGPQLSPVDVETSFGSGRRMSQTQHVRASRVGLP